jgi:hypothetical protein
MSISECEVDSSRGLTSRGGSIDVVLPGGKLQGWEFGRDLLWRRRTDGCRYRVRVEVLAARPAAVASIPGDKASAVSAVSEVVSRGEEKGYFQHRNQ